MSAAAKQYAVFDHDAYARTRAPDDFWGQIRRTVAGKPVDESQIETIVAAIRTGLEFKPNDVLLDLACGNGALSQRLYPDCAALLGVDLSPYMIDIANQYFADAPARRFIAQDAVEYVGAEAAPQSFTKVLCYGSFAYLSQDGALTVLRTLFERFTQVERVFIGNLPDRDRASLFYTVKAASPGELDDSTSQIGIWRTREQFEALAKQAGWRATFSAMPAGFYSSHYRYDVTLVR